MKKILVSFSGGKTSAFMTKWVLNYFRAKKVIVFSGSGKFHHIKHYGIDPVTGENVEIIVVISNTGKERKETLQFAKDCDDHFDFGINYVEALVHFGSRKRSTHTLKRWNQLSRAGQPFEEVIKKYGIPNKSFPHCTRGLKTAPIHSFVKSIGWNNYQTCIGYRADEPKRISRYRQEEEKQWYPLFDDYPVNKPFINEWWNKQDFTLQLEEHEGNCDMCWKKNIKKLVLHAYEKPDLVEWWGNMELKYEYYTPATRSQCNPPYRFYRENVSAFKIMEMSKSFFKEAQSQIDFEVGKSILLNSHPGEEAPNDCEESCEPF